MKKALFTTIAAALPVSASAATTVVDRNEMIETIAYASLGVFIILVAYGIVDVLTPGKLHHRLMEKDSLPLAVVMGALMLGISIIVAASVHG